MNIEKYQELVDVLTKEPCIIYSEFSFDQQDDVLITNNGIEDAKYLLYFNTKTLEIYKKLVNIVTRKPITRENLDKDLHDFCNHVQKNRYTNLYIEIRNLSYRYEDLMTETQKLRKKLSAKIVKGQIKISSCHLFDVKKTIINITKIKHEIKLEDSSIKLEKDPLVEFKNCIFEATKISISSTKHSNSLFLTEELEIKNGDIEFENCKFDNVSGEELKIKIIGK